LVLCKHQRRTRYLDCGIDCTISTLITLISVNWVHIFLPHNSKFFGKIVQLFHVQIFKYFECHILISKFAFVDGTARAFTNLFNKFNVSAIDFPTVRQHCRLPTRKRVFELRKFNGRIILLCNSNNRVSKVLLNDMSFHYALFFLRRSFSFGDLPSTLVVESIRLVFRLSLTSVYLSYYK